MTESLIESVEALGLSTVGHSSEGRPLVAGRFGTRVGRPLLVVGGVHGDEPTSVEAVVELALWLRARPPTRDIWVMPAMNPDGLVRRTKNSARDVDLNRNFPARNFVTQHRPGYCPGPAPLSEPETQVLAALLESVAPEAVVAVHAPLACINYDGPAARWAEAVAQACGWPARADIGYPTPGSLGSWLGIDRGMPVLTLELPAGAYPDMRASAQTALQTAINCERIR